jgi:hypothetical protein
MTLTRSESREHVGKIEGKMMWVAELLGVAFDDFTSVQDHPFLPVQSEYSKLARTLQALVIRRLKDMNQSQQLNRTAIIQSPYPNIVSTKHIQL